MAYVQHLRVLRQFEFVLPCPQVKLSVPTWVPSIITGITSSVTSFKSLPNNKNAMFDVSVAGPLAGMIASLSAIGLGSQLTVTSDMSLFPALPLEILRQSTLGGGIIESVLGSGALSIPEGAIGSMAVASMTIPLHPVAVAGYIGLVVNALCLLPIGSTFFLQRSLGAYSVSLFHQPLTVDAWLSLCLDEVPDF